MNFIPRLYFVLSAVLMNAAGRSLPSHIGKPQNWFLPQNWT